MMSETPPPPKISVLKVFAGMLAGLLLGTLVGVVVCRLVPKYYEAEAFLRDPASPGELNVEIAPAHAAVVVDELDLVRRWGVPFEEALGRVVESTRVVHEEGWTRITVRYARPDETWQIARELAEDFHGIEAETEWARVPVASPAIRREEAAAVRDARWLRSELAGAVAEGGVPRGLTAEQIERHPRFAEVAAGEEFQRWLAALEALDLPEGRYFPPGPPYVPARELVTPVEFPSGPVGLPLEFILRSSQGGGLILAGGVLGWLAMARPRALAPSPPKPPAGWLDDEERREAPPSDW